MALGAAGRAWVDTHYSLPVVLEQLERVLREAVGRTSPVPHGDGGSSGPPGVA